MQGCSFRLSSTPSRGGGFCYELPLAVRFLVPPSPMLCYELPLVVRSLFPPSPMLCSLSSCLYFAQGFRPCDFNAETEQPLRYCSCSQMRRPKSRRLSVLPKVTEQTRARLDWTLSLSFCLWNARKWLGLGHVLWHPYQV